ncbi:carbohydrate ABC transporter permease (plasmid) [Halarchaeum sp. CBA1220]|uniref:carbohydrate ABC transporter permease n=1 Tax=Halarchaeum sp. CBA1220 TaxID=1853682 RepID=UPI000F3A9251|nr:carbohydrate ABC transporter permease [Halarchaeum sp. CBA1220]QLC35065.1 carbohydrate ABC transporter permease [Halarchaeum sp. CBA1220]
MSVTDRISGLFDPDREGVAWERGLRYVAVVLAALFVLVPLYWMVATSLKGSSQIGVFPPALVPSPATIEPYLAAWQTGPWGQWFLNTMLISGGSTVVALAISTPAAYALARFDFPGSNPVYLLFLGLLMIPAQILLIPLYNLLASLGLVDTRVGLILVYSTFFLAFSVFLLHSFMTNLPESLEEAARIGGIPEWKIFIKVILPLVKSGMVATGMLIFVFTWNEFLFALTFLQSEQLYTISVGLQSFQGIHGATVYNQLFAMSTLATLPVVILFALFSDQFIEGIAGLEME